MKRYPAVAILMVFCSCARPAPRGEVQRLPVDPLYQSEGITHTFIFRSATRPGFDAVPLTTLIITHSDGDHINGLPGFPKGLTIVAHEKCKSDIVAAAEALPALKDNVPGKTYDSARLSLYKGGDGEVELAYFGPAHTSGDTVVFFPGEKAVFVGDLLFVGRDPLVHRHKGGNSFGYVRTLEALLALTPPVEVFLSGHADPLGRADVEALRAAMTEKQAKVRAMVRRYRDGSSCGKRRCD